MNNERRRQWIIDWIGAAVLGGSMLGGLWWYKSVPREERSPLAPLVFLLPVMVMSTISYVMQRKQPQSRQKKFLRVMGACLIVTWGSLAMVLLMHLLEPR